MDIKFHIEVKEGVPFGLSKFIHNFNTCSTTQVTLIK
jgi:hypothetical protein